MLLNGVLALSPRNFIPSSGERFQLNYNLIFTIMFIYQEAPAERKLARSSSGEMQNPISRRFEDARRTGKVEKNPLKA
jgi:hypothetical protein